MYNTFLIVYVKCCVTGDDKGPKECLSNDVETNTCKDFNIQKLKTIRAFDATTN